MTDRPVVLWRSAFVAYAVVLLVATHKPGVDVNVVPGMRLDLLIHASAFGLWTLLLGRTRWLGDPARPAAAARLLLVALGYAVLDEASQAVPIFNRVFDPRDMATNAGGAMLAWACAVALARLRSAGAAGATVPDASGGRAGRSDRADGSAPAGQAADRRA
ncbi:MAG: hypothetical protein KatS3mg103_0610 [Phycisphaerales bacterium]|nr:MAG: hypothetical protein KatS3mg103_0610 [Phycisphaerales bacterium]